MTSNRKHSFNDTFKFYEYNDDQHSSLEQPSQKRSTASSSPWMNRIKFFSGSKNDDIPECYSRVRYIRDSCKVFADLWKSDKDLLNKSIDNDICKAFKEFRVSEHALAYRSPYGPNGTPSILNATIDEIIHTHEYIDRRRKEWLEKFRKTSEAAKEKQSTIRQTISEVRDNFERAHRKWDTADANLRKFQGRADRLTILNYQQRHDDLESTRADCELARISSYDLYETEIYRIANEEHALTREFFVDYLSEQQAFYEDVHQYLSNVVPIVEQSLNDDKFAPAFHCDLTEHCQRIKSRIAYPIETCIRLLKDSTGEEGLFRITPSQIKQKKLVAELDLQFISKSSNLTSLGYDAHAVASALKQYLRDLPDCLLTNELVSVWNEIPSLSTEEARIDRIRQLIVQLPEANYDNLCYLLHFLSKVAENSSQNKMTASNLGVCIGSNILFPKDQTSHSYSNGSSLVELMINHHKELFPSDNQIGMPEERLIAQPQPDVVPVSALPKSSMKSAINVLSFVTQRSAINNPKKQRAPPVPFTGPIPAQTETNHSNNKGSRVSSPRLSVNNQMRDASAGRALGSSFPSSPRHHKSTNSINEPEKSPRKNKEELLIDFSTDPPPPPSKTTRSSAHRDNKPTSPGEITQF